MYIFSVLIGSGARNSAAAVLREWFAVGEAHWRSVRGDPWFGRRLPGILRQAGFQPTIPSASFDVYGDQEGVRLIADVASSRCHDPDYVQQS